jgi:SAM-dependent methyltransferase
MSTIPTPDPGPFRAFEHAGWEGVGPRYHDAFGGLTTQAVVPLLDAVEAARGVRLLDMATGPGYVAGAAAQRGARAVGVDFSSAMLAEAQRRYPRVEFREGDAEALPFPDGGFDATVMNFGLLHLGRPERAVQEAHRVLRAGGRFGFTVWAGPEEAVGFGIVLRAIRAHGAPDTPLPPGPPFFRFSDPDECRRALLGAGFAQPDIARISQTWRLPSPDALFETMLRSTVRTAGLLRAQSDEALKAIRSSVRQEVSAYRKGEGIELPMPALLASAAKP